MKKILPLLLLVIINNCYSQTASTQKSRYTGSLDFLYWELREGGADNWAQLIAPAGTDQPVKVIDVPFKPSAGFKIGIDRQSEQQYWDFIGLFTHYQTSASAHAAGEVYSDYLGNFYASNTDGSSFGPYYDQGFIQWNMTYNTLDLDVGHAFAPDNVLSLLPFFGLKAAMINQDIKTQWQNPHSPPKVTPPKTYSFTEANENLKNDFLGVGPAIGVNTTWSLLKDKQYELNLNGNILASIMLGHWRFDDVYRTTNGSTPFSSTINSRDFYSAATMASGLLGIEWKRALTSSDLLIRLGYEAQVWFNQIQYYSFNQGRTNNIMSLQGATLDFTVKLK